MRGRRRVKYIYAFFWFFIWLRGEVGRRGAVAYTLKGSPPRARAIRKICRLSSRAKTGEFSFSLLLPPLCCCCSFLPPLFSGSRYMDAYPSVSRCWYIYVMPAQQPWGRIARHSHSWYHFLSLYLSMSEWADEAKFSDSFIMRPVRSSSCDSLSPRSSTI